MQIQDNVLAYHSSKRTFSLDLHLVAINKKSELMLKRRARAYSSSCSQVILVYLSIPSQFTLLKPKIANKSLKTYIFRVQGHLRSSTLTFFKKLVDR